jgi:hypothetical protein
MIDFEIIVSLIRSAIAPLSAFACHTDSSNQRLDTQALIDAAPTDGDSPGTIHRASSFNLPK